MNTTERLPAGSAPGGGATRRWYLRLVAPARVVAGGMYIAGGLIPFTHWGTLPMPNVEVGQFLDVLVESDMLKVSKSIEVIFGALLMLNLWVPLSVAILAPVLFFIAWVDWYMDPYPSGVIAVSVLVFCHLLLTYVHRDAFLPMLARKAVPK